MQIAPSYFEAAAWGCRCTGVDRDVAAIERGHGEAAEIVKVSGQDRSRKPRIVRNCGAGVNCQVIRPVIGEGNRIFDEVGITCPVSQLDGPDDYLGIQVSRGCLQQ